LLINKIFLISECLRMIIRIMVIRMERMELVGFFPWDSGDNLGVGNDDALPGLEDVDADPIEDRRIERDYECSLLFASSAYAGEDSPQIALGDLMGDQSTKDKLSFAPSAERESTVSPSEASSSEGAAEVSQTPAKRVMLKGVKVKAHGVSMEDLSPLFNLTTKAAAKELGMCETSLKKISRDLGLKRWPGRTVRAKQKQSTKNAKM
jgi:hypothetical protein